MYFIQIFNLENDGQKCTTDEHMCVCMRTIVIAITILRLTEQVQEGVDYLLFNLLILGSITDREGYVWCRSPVDLYVIETMPLMQREAKTAVSGALEISPK